MLPSAPIGRRAARHILKVIGAILLRLLTRTRITGRERVPPRGPFIIAGNHRAVMEIFLMLVVTRPQVDIIGSGDFPLDPSFRFLAKLYGYIPYRRGSVDSRALRRALSVLRARNVVGIFPEGGIWTAGSKETQRGVAWLAAKSGAPVVPMAFAGIDDGVARTMTLQFPTFEAHVGQPLSFESDEITKSSLDEFSRKVMARIDEMLPEWDKNLRPRPKEETYWITLRWWENSSTATPDGEIHRDDEEASVLSRFYHLPVLISIFEVNLRRNVAALKAWETPQSAREIIRAINRVLGYLKLRNRYLFTYRLGEREGRLLEQAFANLKTWLSEHPDAMVQIIPTRRRVWRNGDVEENTSTKA